MNLRFAATWHVLWGALLVPYALVVELIVGGMGPTQDLVDGLAKMFLIVPLFVAITLPINVAIAFVLERLLRGTAWWAGPLISAAILGGVWLLLGQVVGPPDQLGVPMSADGFALVDAGAGAAFGFVVALGFEPFTEGTRSPS